MTLNELFQFYWPAAYIVAVLFFLYFYDPGRGWFFYLSLMVDAIALGLIWFIYVPVVLINWWRSYDRPTEKRRKKDRIDSSKD